MDETITAREVRRHWITGQEIAVIDVREEGPYSESHPLFAVNVPVSEIEVGFPSIPRLDTPIVVYDNGEGYVKRAIPKIQRLGFTNVKTLEGGLSAYRKVGEVYRDVNVPSKAFGELVESIRHTPSLPALEVKQILEKENNVVVVDSRRFEEFNTMSIPRGQSCPGGELVYRIEDVVSSPETLVIVNCAGRTRSIIGTQSLINSGIPNKVVALRNGTIGWLLEGLELEHSKTDRAHRPTVTALASARTNAERWAKHAGVPIISTQQLCQFQQEKNTRNLYLLDVRDPEEYALQHPEGFTSAPGGQLVQAIDEWVPVRGARIVLYDADGVRARMTASWVLQMGWEVYVVEEKAKLAQVEPTNEKSIARSEPSLGDSAITASDLQSMADVTIVDLARSPTYRKGHIPGAWFASGPELVRDLKSASGSGPIVLTSPDGKLAAAVLAETQDAVVRKIHYLAGGTKAWVESGYPMETETRWLSDPIDVYKRPYEGTDNAKANMQSYIDWELQLVAQLANDGVAGFHVVRAPER